MMLTLGSNYLTLIFIRVVTRTEEVLTSGLSFVNQAFPYTGNLSFPVCHIFSRDSAIEHQLIFLDRLQSLDKGLHDVVINI